MDRNERRLAQKAATKSVAQGIDPSRLNPYVVAELARQIFDRVKQGRRQGNIDLPVEYLLSKIDLTIAGMPDVKIACGKGCSHCCNIWVSATAPEVLFLAKRLRSNLSSVVQKVQEAYDATRNFSHAERPYNTFPCPLLTNDLCSVYNIRPLFCRLAASGNAEICRRSYTNITDENIPTPAMYIFGREAYSIALAAALKHAGLPYLCYELNSALNLALSIPTAEVDWLAGVDLFANALREDGDPFTLPHNQMLYEMAFGQSR